MVTPNNLASRVHIKRNDRSVYLGATSYFMNFWYLELALAAKQRSQEKLESLYDTAAQSVDLTDVL